MISRRAFGPVVRHEGPQPLAGELRAKAAVFDFLIQTAADEMAILVPCGDATATLNGIIGALAAEITAETGYVNVDFNIVCHKLCLLR
jgi:hypothetical protein